jgi:ribose 5-phosphate isomerase B
MKYAVGSDQRSNVTDWAVDELRRRGAQVELHGALSPGDDARWPGVAQKVAARVASGECEQGVLFCWTGTGVSMAANKVPGVRAALCTDAETARGARLWNDANVLCMSLRLTTPQLASEILDAWASTSSIDESERENIEQVRDMDRQRAGRVGSR